MFKRLITLAALVITTTLVYAHGDATHLTGTITAIEGDHIEIKDTAGKAVLVMLQKTTKFMKADKPSTKSELKVGTRVVIDAKMDAKMKMYAAEEVAIGITETAKPAAPKAGAAKAR
jgi:hypothetical protein